MCGRLVSLIGFETNIAAAPAVLFCWSTDPSVKILRLDSLFILGLIRLFSIYVFKLIFSSGVREFFGLSIKSM